MIQVAYDISMIGTYYYRPNFQVFGIYRVIEETLAAIAQLEDVAVTAVNLLPPGSCPDRVQRALGYFLYCEDRQKRLGCPMAAPIQSRLGLLDLYRRIYSEGYAIARQQSSRTGVSALAIRLLRKGLSYLQQRDVSVAPLPADCQIFHSTYAPLPPVAVTGDRARVITIYDLIPVVAPQFVQPEMTASFEAILESIRPEQDWVICISDYTRQEFCRYTGMSPDRVFAVPLAAAAHFYPVQDQEAIAQIQQQYQLPTGPYFLSLATFQPRKNIAHLIRSFDQLLAQHPHLEVCLILIGAQGWRCEDMLAASQASERLRSRVQFLGYVPDADLSAIYSGAIAFVYPSLYEGFGLPPLEAMQCGVPVITSNVTSLPEVVGNAALLVDPTDPDALSAAMVSLLQDPQLRQNLRQKSAEQAGCFSWSRTARETVAVYQQALAEEVRTR